jgi:hypothetical protein
MKEKSVSFIKVYAFDDRFLHIHTELYEKLHINENHLPSIGPERGKKTELDIFEANLDKVLVTK